VRRVDEDLDKVYSDALWLQETQGKKPLPKTYYKYLK